MKTFEEDLRRFARAIVKGGDIAPQIIGAYANYDAATAIEVYRNNYRGNLQDALAAAYSVVKKLVGDDFFRYMAEKYIGAHPSRCGDLNRYGASLAEFLAFFEPAKALAYLPDVARLEWACQLAWFAPDEPPFPLQALAQVPRERYPELILRTSGHLIGSEFPIAKIWQAHQADSDCDADVGCGGCIALVYRRDGAVRVDELSAAQACWLQCIRDGRTLGAATAATLEKYPDFDLQRALSAAQLTGFHLE